MKNLIVGCVAIVTVSGCATTPEATKNQASTTDRSQTYAVQVVEIQVPAALATDAFPRPISGLDATHVYTIPNQKDLPPFYIRARDLNDVRARSASVEKLMQRPEARISKLPPVNVAVGGQAVVDQTVTNEIPVDYNVVGGKTVATKAPYRIGRSIDLRLIRADESTATYKLNMYIGRLKGYETYTMKNGDDVKMPLVASRSCNTEISQPLGLWDVIGGMAYEQTDNNTTNKTSVIFCAKIISSKS